METVDEVLVGLEGKVVAKVEQQLYNSRDITIMFTDGTIINIGAIGDDHTYVIAD